MISMEYHILTQSIVIQLIEETPVNESTSGQVVAG